MITSTPKFINVEQMLDYLPEDELLISLHLRKLIKETLPNNTIEKLSFNVPFYKLNANICFIWPGSVKWGKKRTYNGVRIGFTRGHLLNDPEGFLKKEHRKQVYWNEFNDVLLVEKQFTTLQNLLLDAARIDALYKR